MAVNKNTYGLPDATLQLIGAAPELNFGSAQQGGVPMSNLISALRGERSSNNPGVRLLANRANGDGITFNRKPTSLSKAIPILKMPKAITPDVTLPGGETQTPYVRPDRPVVPDLIYPDIVDPFVDPEDPVDPDPEDPDPEDPEILDPDVIDPDVIDPDPVDPDPVDPDPVTPDPVDPDPVDPDWVDPTELDPFVLDPLVYPEEPKKDRDGTVIIEEVDPNEESPQDDGTTGDILDLINSGLVPGDQDDVIQDDGTTDGIQDIIDSLGDGSIGSDDFSDYSAGGGGKYFDDQSAATMAFAKGGKVTPNRLAGPNPAGPDDGYATLKNGEFVLNKETAEAIGYELLNRLNRSRP